MEGRKRGRKGGRKEGKEKKGERKGGNRTERRVFYIRENSEALIVCQVTLGCWNLNINSLNSSLLFKTALEMPRK